MLVILTLVNPKKDSDQPLVKKFLLTIDPEDDDAFFRLRAIDGHGFYYKPQPLLYVGCNVGKEPKYHVEKPDDQWVNLNWFAGLCGGYAGKWSEVGENLKRNIDVANFSEVVVIDKANQPVHSFTIITEFRH